MEEKVLNKLKQLADKMRDINGKIILLSLLAKFEITSNVLSLDPSLTRIIS